MVTADAAVLRTGQNSWITGAIETPAGRIPRVANGLNWQDRLGTIKVRVGLQRMHYRVEPGLYAV